MSMPPAINTTSRPTAQITLTELLFRSEAKLPSVRKLFDASDRNRQIARRTRNNLVSVGLARMKLRIDGYFQLMQSCPSWVILTDKSAPRHVKNAVGVEIHLGDFV